MPISVKSELYLCQEYKEFVFVLKLEAHLCQTKLEPYGCQTAKERFQYQQIPETLAVIGGSVWESNSPETLVMPLTGFEVQAHHQAQSAPVWRLF